MFKLTSKRMEQICQIVIRIWYIDVISAPPVYHDDNIRVKPSETTPLRVAMTYLGHPNHPYLTKRRNVDIRIKLLAVFTPNDVFTIQP